MLFVACLTAIMLLATQTVYKWDGIIFTDDHLAGRPLEASTYYRIQTRYSEPTPEQYDKMKENYQTYDRTFWRLTAAFAAMGLLTLLSLLHLLSVCGSRLHSKGQYLTVFDKPWLDVSLGAVIALAAVGVEVVLRLDRLMYSSSFNRFQVILGVILSLWTTLALWWILSAVKRIKDRSILKHTLIYTVLALIFRFISRFIIRPTARFFRALYNGFSVTVQVGACAVGFGLLLLLVATPFLDRLYGMAIVMMLFLTACAAVFFIWKASHLANVIKGLDRLAKGDYKTPVEERGHGVLLQMAKDVNAATDGLKAAVQNELSSERFKAELITNVSHDLRTPLTSVITYADLLQSEGLDAPDAGKYLEVIQQKARRLQALTEDLFEAAKASSGETRAVLIPLEMGQLIEQAMGEMGDRLRAVPLDVHVSGGCGLVIADGRLLCRVFENLLRNIEKYAMPGTRVYIDTSEVEGHAAVTLRNIAKNPIEGGAERLTERFTRGDEARSSEGSGLGLAIVKSFMDLQKGTCEILVDGDLFKVVLTMPLAG